MKRSKQNYFIKSFESNLTNSTITGRGIKSSSSMRSASLITSTLLTFQNETIDNPKRIANIFNNLQASAYEVCDRTCTPLHTPKTLETCKKKHTLFD